MGCNLKFTFKFVNLILRLNQVLTVEVTVRSNCLVKVLLSLKFRLKVNVFLLKFTDKVLFKFDLLDHLQQVWIGFSSFKWELISFLFQCNSLRREWLLDLFVCKRLFSHASNSLLVLFSRVLHFANFLDDLVEVVFEKVFLVLKALKFLPVDISLFTKPLDFTCKRRNGVCGNRLLLDCFFSCITESFVLWFEFEVLALGFLTVLLVLFVCNFKSVVSFVEFIDSGQ